MKPLLYVSSALALIMSMTACISENQDAQDLVSELKTINIIGPEAIEFEPINALTKGTAVQNGSALVFSWAVGDTLGIFPNKGNQVEFPITASEGSTSASFDGGGWALRNNSSYAAYYPFSVWNYHRNNETILLDYSGQVQNGNGSFAHLSAYDYLASAKTTPQNSAVTFQMDRMGSILYIDIVVPEPEHIQSLMIECEDAIFAEEVALDISGDSPVIIPTRMVNVLTLSFENTETTEINETVRAYLAVQPVDFSQKTVTATLVTESHRYTAPVTSRVVNKGKAAFLRFADAFTPTLALEESSVYLTVGRTFDMMTTVWPATCQDISWASSNEAVATISSSGIVTAHTLGSATITATAIEGGSTSTCTVTVVDEGVEEGHEWVDLGLPSGILWAKCNIGASSPEEYGEYYTWGETAPKSSYQEKDDSNYSSYYQQYTKYVISPVDEYYGIVDNKTTLETQDDAAGVNWGGSWRMPSQREFAELISYCDSEWTSFNGVYGHKLTSKINSNSIFLPAAGCKKSSLLKEGTEGCYWSSSLYTGSMTRYANFLLIDSGKIKVTSGYYRWEGFSIRPVTDKGVRVAVTGITLNQNTLSLAKGDNVWLSATVYPSNATQPAVVWSSSNPAVAYVNCSGKVDALLSGSATVTATTYDGGIVAACQVTVSGNNFDDANGHAWVDLGLPSGLKWATCNVGANVPEEYGNYYAWGETSSKTDYSENTYLWNSGNDDNRWLTKYCTSSGYGNVDNLKTLSLSDDAARINWGGGWRVPTMREFAELINSDYCTTIWTSLNGVYGLQVSSKINGNSIFLPASGYYYGTTYNLGFSGGIYGCYYSSSLGDSYYPWNAYYLLLGSSILNIREGERPSGRTIRPVIYATSIAVSGVTMDQSTLDLAVGMSSSITATVSPSNATNKNVTWSTSNSSVATVSSSGVVTANAAGSATITATTADGGYTASCSVRVLAASPLSVSNNVGTLDYCTLSRTMTAPFSTVYTAAGLTQSEFAAGYNAPSVSSLPTGVSYSTNGSGIVMQFGNAVALGAGSVLFTFTPKTAYQEIYPTIQYTVQWNIVFDEAMAAMPLDLDYVLYEGNSQLNPLIGTDITPNPGVDTLRAVIGKTINSQFVIQSSLREHIRGGGTSYAQSFPSMNINKVSMSINYSKSQQSSYSAIITPAGDSFINQEIRMQTPYSQSEQHRDYVIDMNATLANGATIMVKEYIVRFICPFYLEANDIQLHTHRSESCQARAGFRIKEQGSDSILATYSDNGSFTVSSYALYTYLGVFNDMESFSYNWTTDVAFGGRLTYDQYGMFYWNGAGYTLSQNLNTTYRVTQTLSGVATLTDQGNITVLSSANSSPTHSNHNAIGVTSISLNQSSITLIKGESSTLTATVSPSNATDKSVTWTSSNPEAVSVSSTGIVSALHSGTATVTATTNDGSFAATCNVRVIPYSSSAENITYNIGNVTTLPMNLNIPISAISSQVDMSAADFLAEYYAPTLANNTPVNGFSYLYGSTNLSVQLDSNVVPGSGQVTFIFQPKLSQYPVLTYRITWNAVTN